MSNFWNSFAGVWLGFGSWYTTQRAVSLVNKLFFKSDGTATKKLTDNEVLIKEYEEKHNTKVVTIVHQEAVQKKTMLNYLFTEQENKSSLKLSEAVKIQRLFSDMNPDQNVVIVLHTPGGEMSACKIIVDVIRNHKGYVKVFIPFYAFSAGTIIALASDEIVMHPTAEVGPTDPQLLFPANAFLRVIKKADEEKRDLNDLTRIFGEIASPAREQSEELIRKLVTRKVEREYEHFKVAINSQEIDDTDDIVTTQASLALTNSSPYVKDGKLIDVSELETVTNHVVKSLLDSIYTHDHSFNVDELAEMGLVVRHEPHDYDELYALSKKIID